MRKLGVKLEQDKKSPEKLNCQVGFLCEGANRCPQPGNAWEQG